MKPAVLALLVIWALCCPEIALGHSELAFLPNQGQWKGPFDYKANSEGVSLFISGTKATVVMTPPAGHPHPVRPRPGTPAAFAFEIRFRNARPGVKPVAGISFSHPVHFIGPEGNHTVSPARQVEYPGALPGKGTLLWRSTEGRAAFDLLLPGRARLDDQGFSIHGAGFSLTAEGAIEVATPYGPVTLTAPVARHPATGKAVACRFRLDKDGGVGFSVGQGYDKDLPLLIDPTLIFSTYSGSRADNWGNTATYGPGGTMFSGGIAFDRGFPATLGALDTTYHGAVDIGILKYSADGRRLLWATYLGGAQTETAHSLVSTAEGRLYVLASTSSANFPTRPGAFDRTFNGGPQSDPMGYSFVDYWYPSGADYVIACLDTNGARLTASTFLGGTGNDGILPAPTGTGLTRNYGDQFKGEIVLDAQGRVCITGTTTSADFPVRNGLGLAYRGGGDAIVARLSPDLSTLQSASFFGGTGADAAYGIAFDSAGNAYISGGTQSANLPDAFGPPYAGGTDGFITALNPQMQAIQRTRYLGTAAYDQAYLVQTDQAGNVYAVGQTAGSWPVTAGTYSNPQGGQFLVSFTQSLAAQRFTTRFGGPRSQPDMVLTAFLVDDCGKIYVSGWGGSSNGSASGYIGGSVSGLPVTPNAHKGTTDGSDFYLMVLDRDARSLNYATFFGATGGVGEHVDGGTSRFDKKGVVYQAVCACGGSNFPTTPGVWSPENQSVNCNNAGFKFDFSLLRARFSLDTLSGCSPFTVQLRNQSEFAQSYLWSLGPDTTSRRDTAFSHTFTRPGTYRITLRALNPEVCQRVDSASVLVRAVGVDILSDTTYRICQAGGQVTLTNLVRPGYRYRWTPAFGLNSDTTPSPSTFVIAGPDMTYTVMVTTPEGCRATRRMTISNRMHLVRISNLPRDTSVCGSLTMAPAFTALGRSDSVVWDYGDGVRFSGMVSPFHTWASPGVYKVSVTSFSDTLCTPIASDTVIVRIQGPQAYPDSSYRYCTAADTLQLRNLVVPGYRYRWVPAQGLSSDTVPNPVFYTAQQHWPEYTCFITSPDGCETIRHVRINDGILEANIQSMVDRTLCVGDTTPALKVTDTHFVWSEVRWSVNGQPYPDSLEIRPDPYTHYLTGFQFGAAGRYLIRIHVSSTLTCLSEASDSVAVWVGKTPIPADTLLRLCPEDNYRLVVPSRDAIASTRWLPVGGQLPEFNGRFTDEITLTAAMVDTFGCRLQRNYTLEQQRLSAQTSVVPAYDPCTDSITITLAANPFLPAEGANWVWRNEILPSRTVIRLAGSSVSDTAFMYLFLRGCEERVPFLVQAQGVPTALKADFSTRILYSDCGSYPAIRAVADTAGCAGCQYRWSFPGQAQQPQGATADHQAQNAQVPITLTVSEGSCIRSATRMVEVSRLNVPNVVTPGTDGRNDAIALPADGAALTITIYNRYGRQVYKGSGADWPRPDTGAGTYFYTVGPLQGSGACQGWIEVAR